MLPKGDTVKKICMKIAFWKVIPGNTRKEVRKVNKEGRKVYEVHGRSGCPLVAPGGHLRYQVENAQ